MPRSSYKFAVIGNGLIGSAVAKYLGSKSKSVLVVGPDEPPDLKAHNGVFASHYDSGRITRILDTDYVWGLLAKKSIERYRQIEQESGIDFFDPVGCLKVVPDNDWGRSYLAANVKIGAALKADFESVSHGDLRSLFDFLAFPSNSIGLFEKSTAGWIDPRRLIKAQNLIAGKDGVEFCREAVVQRTDTADGAVELRTDKETILRAENVIITAGAFSNFFGLFSERLKLTVRAETIVKGELSTERGRELGSMPSLIWFLEGNDVSSYLYAVPPVVYPDGRAYVKIGGDSERDHTFTDTESIKKWFHTDGGQATKDAFTKALKTLLPEEEFLSWQSAPCVITDTKTERPYIGKVEEHVFVCTGGCGAAAKSSDEIGRLGAEFTLHRSFGSEYQPDDFDVITHSTSAELSGSKRKFHF